MAREDDWNTVSIVNASYSSLRQIDMHNYGIEFLRKYLFHYFHIRNGKKTEVQMSSGNCSILSHLVATARLTLSHWSSGQKYVCQKYAVTEIATQLFCLS